MTWIGEQNDLTWTFMQVILLPTIQAADQNIDTRYLISFLDCELVI